MKVDHSDMMWTFVPTDGYRSYRVRRNPNRIWRACTIAMLVMATIMLCLIDAQAASAQQPPVLPDPSQLENQFEERKLPQSSFIIRGRSTEDQQIAPSEDIRFVLKSLNITGASVFDDAELQLFYQELIDTEISVAQLFEVAASLSAHYRNRGYILSRVSVPAQEVMDGAVTLAAVEGYIHKVTIEGDIMMAASKLASLGDKITQSRPLLAKDLERYMLLANDIPGVVASAVLQASEQPGATDLTIVVDQKKTQFFSSVNNRGSRFNGPVQGQIGGFVNGLLGGGSRTGVRMIGSAQISEFKLLEVSHLQVLGSEGTTLQLVGRRTFSEPGSSLRDLEIEADSIFGRVMLQHPIIRSRARSLYVRSMLDIRNTETDILSEEFSEDRIRVARLGASYDFVDRFNGINLLDVEVSGGLNILNATRTRDPFQSRADAETNFLKVTGSVTRLQRIVPKVSLLLDAAGQFTSDGLVAAEEFALGGGQFGRAFDPSEISGDRGVAARAELRYDGETSAPWLKQYQLYVFGDYGIVWNQQAGSYQSVDLGSAGGGVRLTLNDNISAYVELAVPYEKTPDFEARWGNSVRGFAGISLRF